MDGNTATGPWTAGRQDHSDEKLDRALVSGLMLEVILETRGLSADPTTHRREVKQHLKDSLVTHLAGRVTLDRFHRLVRKVDDWFPVYYPLVTGAPPQPPDGMAARIPALAKPPVSGVLREDLLLCWFEEEIEPLLPRRAHRKLGPNRLLEFLRRTRGGWFRLKDFESHFRVDRKTAWEYLQKLLHAGLLRHNRARSAAVRYALAGRFLVVPVDILAARVETALADLPRALRTQVTERLVTAGSEAFDGDAWLGHLDPARRRQVITRLLAAGLLESCPAGALPMMRLVRCW
jgi:hypothetical protein